MSKTIEQLKAGFINQAKEESKLDYDSVETTIDDIIERVALFIWDVAYEKGWNDCSEDYDIDDEPYEEDVADVFNRGVIKGKKM
jgi:hypothetical protein